MWKAGTAGLVVPFLAFGPPRAIITPCRAAEAAVHAKHTYLLGRCLGFEVQLGRRPSALTAHVAILQDHGRAIQSDSRALTVLSDSRCHVPNNRATSLPSVPHLCSCCMVQGLLGSQLTRVFTCRTGKFEPEVIQLLFQLLLRSQDAALAFAAQQQLLQLLQTSSSASSGQSCTPDNVSVECQSHFFGLLFVE